MSEESKYYTPDISEFYVGFQYEIKTPSLTEFVETIYSEDDFNEGAFRQGTEFRVKHLNREDVESCGWRVIKEPYRWQFELIKGRYKLICDIYTSKDFFPKSTIKIIDNRDADNYTIFLGYIKNKSELIKIMKQLGIND